MEVVLDDERSREIVLALAAEQAEHAVEAFGARCPLLVEGIRVERF